MHRHCRGQSAKNRVQPMRGDDSDGDALAAGKVREKALCAAQE
jgi:hypothetical protein